MILYLQYLEVSLKKDWVSVWMEGELRLYLMDSSSKPPVIVPETVAAGEVCQPPLLVINEALS